MNKNIRLNFGSDRNETSISNIFIDNYMADAHGSYVKVYIYLLRCLSDPSMEISLSAIADRLDETEKDITKALKYWEKKNVLALRCDRAGNICDITIVDLNDTEPTISLSVGVQTPACSAIAVQDSEPDPSDIDYNGYASPAAYRPSSPEVVKLEEIAPVNYTKPSYTSAQLAQIRRVDEFDRLIDYIEDKLGRTLTQKDLQTPAFLYETLEFSCELIRYLYDYCLNKGKKSAAYIEKVARSWKEQGITDIEQASSQAIIYSAEYTALCRGFGIDRNLGESELRFLNSWTTKYGMTAELIAEACTRTLNSIGKPDFRYAEGIIKAWANRGANTMEAVAGLDEEFARSSADAAKRTAAAAKAQADRSVKAAQAKTVNKFSQFPQRSHDETDYSALEKKLLGQN